MRLHYASALLALILIGSFLLPPEKIVGPLDFGARGGGNAAFMANFARSYHHTGWQFKDGLPATYRSPDGTADPKDLYCSQIPYIYLTYALWTGLAGFSPAALRVLALLFCLAGALLVWRLLWGENRYAAVVGLALYLTAPLTLEYGLMPESTMPEGVALLAALWGYQQYAAQKQGLLFFLLLSIPLLLCASHISAFFIAAVFVSHFFVFKNFKGALRPALLLSLPWAVLLAIHLGMIYDATGSLDAFFNRAGARGFAAAFQMGRNPLLTVARHWQERLGIPLCLFFLAGLLQAWRNRHASRIDLAPWLALAGVFLCLHTVLLEWMAQHRYTLQILFPAMVWLAAPAMAKVLQQPGWKRWVAALLLFLCAGMFIRKHSQWQPADPEAVFFGQAAQTLGKTLPQGSHIALLLPKGRFATTNIVQYYSRLKVTTLTPASLPSMQAKDYDGFLALDLPLPPSAEGGKQKGRTSFGYAPGKGPQR